MNSLPFTSCVLALVLALPALAQTGRPFVHPGILQTRADLEFMKAKVAAGEQPWKQAWDNLRAQSYSSLDFQPKPVTHIARGAFGSNSNGDRELSASANAAYSHALQWYITGKKQHAHKAIEILAAWSNVLWDFEGNDAKLLAGWTGGALCNAAEILRSTDSGWDSTGIDSFKRLILTVYYPVLKDYFPEANGNWDAAILDTLLSIGIFCDDRTIFDNAVNHYLRGSGNGGITKYIYPSGQCDENARDQGHTQLGLGHFARAARVASSQGVDLWTVADNRLAVGFEYTARYMFGEEVPAYGVVSPLGRGRFSDIYEAVYQHYHFEKRFDMPYTARAVQQARERGWTALVMDREQLPNTSSVKGPFASGHAPFAGAQTEPTTRPPTGAVEVSPEQSIQQALDKQAASGGWVVLSKGLHTISASLRMPSGVTLAGLGRESVLYFDPKAPAANAAVAIVNATDDLHDVTLRDFVVEGSTLSKPLADPNQDHRIRSNQNVPVRGGIAFAAQRFGQMRNLRFEHLTVRNCTHNGVAIRGAANVEIVASDFSDNGGSVVPGPGLQHNLLLTRVNGAEVKDNRLDDSPWGSGLDLTFSRDVSISNNEAARNGSHGIHISESENVHVVRNLSEANDGNGIAFEKLFSGSQKAAIQENICRNNGGSGIRLAGVDNPDVGKNSSIDNGRPD